MRLSILMPNYNHGHFLESRIASILAQCSADDELIIVDDASVDHSVSIVTRYASADPRVQLIQNSQNMGPVKSANRALQHAKGTYIACLASDDVILPGFIEKTMGIFSHYPEIGIVCSQFVEWDDRFPPPYAEHSSPLSRQEIRTHIFPSSSIGQIFWNTNFWISGNTAVTRRCHLLTYGPFEDSFGHLCDWFLLHLIALFEGVVYIPSPLALFRKNNQSYSSQLHNQLAKRQKFEKNIFRFLSLPGNKEIRRRFQSAGLYRFIVRGNIGYLLQSPSHWNLLFLFFYRGICRKFKTLALKGKNNGIDYNSA